MGGARVFQIDSTFTRQGVFHGMASPQEPFEYPSPDHMADILPSHLAAANNNVSELSRLVGEEAELEDHRSKETPLHAAAKSGSLDTLKWMVAKGVGPLEAKSSRNGYTAAHLAVVRGHFQCLKVIVTIKSREKLHKLARSKHSAQLMWSIMNGEMAKCQIP